MDLKLYPSQRTVFTVCVRGLNSKRKTKQNNNTAFYNFVFRAVVDLLVDSWQTSFSHRVCPGPDIRDVCVWWSVGRQYLSQGGGGLSPLNLARCWIKSRQAGALPPAAAMPPLTLPHFFLIGWQKKHVQLCVGLSSCVHGAVSLSRPMFMVCEEG